MYTNLWQNVRTFDSVKKLKTKCLPDKCLRDPHCLQEILWTLHFSHEVGENVCSTIGENSVHDTVERSDEAACVWNIVVVLDWRILSVLQLVNTAILERRASTENSGSCVIWRTMGSHNHSQDHNEHVEENGHVSEPSKLLQRSDLAENHADDYEDDDANDVTKVELRYNRKSQSVRDRDQGDGQDELYGLQNIDRDTRSLAVTRDIVNERFRDCG